MIGAAPPPTAGCPPERPAPPIPEYHSSPTRLGPANWPRHWLPAEAHRGSSIVECSVIHACVGASRDSRTRTVTPQPSSSFLRTARSRPSANSCGCCRKHCAVDDSRLNRNTFRFAAGLLWNLRRKTVDDGAHAGHEPLRLVKTTWTIAKCECHSGRMCASSSELKSRRQICIRSNATPRPSTIPFRGRGSGGRR